MKGKPEMWTAKRFAKEAGISYTTMMDWLSKNLVPGAVLKQDDRGLYWEIPSTSLTKIQRPKTGRPKKSKK